MSIVKAKKRCACSIIYFQVTSAIRNSLQYNPSGQPEDGPMGISIALSPTEHNASFRKDAITNASFRTKRMPGMEPLKETISSYVREVFVLTVLSLYTFF